MLSLLFWVWLGGPLPQRVELVGGYGEDTQNYRIALEWDLFERKLQRIPFLVSATLTPNYSKFESTRSNSVTYSSLTDYGITPVISLFPTRYASSALQPFMEMGIGAHYLTRKGVSEKTFSTNFQFGDHIGFGFVFGPQRRYRIAYVFQHLSNGGIGSPNPGINFHLATFSFKLPLNH